MEDGEGVALDELESSDREWEAVDGGGRKAVESVAGEVVVR